MRTEHVTKHASVTGTTAWAAWLAVGYAIAACGSNAPAPDAPASAAPSEETGAGAAAPPPSSAPSGGDASEEDAGADVVWPDLYDPETIPRFELTFGAAAMAVLSSTTPLDELTWVHGSIKMGPITFADVGVRRKGSTSLRALPKKASLKVKLNKWVKGQKLYGLSELTLNNMVNDPTSLAERLSYHVFRSLGLPGQKANTAHLTINGEDYGIYANIESPNAAFLARVFGKNAKTLYEVNWGSEWETGNEPGFEIDVPDPKAPAGTRPDLTRLFQAVELATDATLLANLEPHLHTTRWLRHSAAEAVTGAYDGYGFGVWISHNYFMAGDTNGKFSLIPWSTDESFSDREGVPNAAAPRLGTVLARCKLGGTCWNAYRAEVQSVLDVVATLDLVNLAKKWHDQIDALAKADPKSEHGLDAYAQQTDLLYTWLAARPSVVKAQLGL